MKTTLICALFAVTWTADALAKEGRGIGVGVTTLVGADPFDGAAATVEFDVGTFQIDGLLGFALVENQASTMTFGGRFYFVAHSTQSSDFSVGGGAGTIIYDPERGDTEYGMYVEGGGKIRAFVTPSVALTVTLGISAIFLDESSASALGGQATGSAGILYFF